MPPGRGLGRSPARRGAETLPQPRPGVLPGARGLLTVAPFPGQGLAPNAAIGTGEARRRGVFP